MNRLRLLSYGIISILVLAVTFSCSEQNQKPTLAVSIEPQRYLLEQIAGDKWQVVTMLAQNADPENFDPPVSTLRQAAKARAYFKVGQMPFEDKIVESISQSSPLETVDCSRGIAMLHGTHTGCSDHHHDHGDDADPHVWSSVKNARIMAANMLDGLVKIDPDNTDYYRANYDRLAARLDSLDTALAAQLAPRRGQAFVVWHPSLSYFARDYSLEQIAIGMENKEMSAGEFRRRIDLARQHNASVFFLQPGYDAGRSADVAAQTHADTCTVNLLDYDFIATMTRVADALSSRP